MLGGGAVSEDRQRRGVKEGPKDQRQGCEGKFMPDTCMDADKAKYIPEQVVVGGWWGGGETGGAPAGDAQRRGACVYV